MGERESNWRGSHMLPKRRNTFDAIFFLSLSLLFLFTFFSRLFLLSLLFTLHLFPSIDLYCINLEVE